MNKSAIEASEELYIPPTRQKPSFWLLHCAGWLIYWFLFLIENTVLSFGSSNYLIGVPLFVSASLAALLTLPLRYIYRRFWRFSPQNILLLVILSCIVVALLWTPAKNIAMWTIHPLINPEIDHSKKAEMMDIFNYFSGLTYSLAMILAWSTLYFSVNFYFRLVAEKEMHLAAARLSHSAQIKMLRYQINPHFLFNTLNAISTLVIMGNKEKANDMLVKLSTFLRFSLDNDPEKKVVLYEELKALMLYLDIEKTRFDERLNIHFELSETTENYLVPSLLLQPLVENSIKYSIAKMPSGGEISISAKEEDGYLQLEISDNGPDGHASVSKIDCLNHQTDKGVGLRNIKERLAVLYPNNYQFMVKKNLPSGLSVCIRLPIEK
ncbi:sensor histidine kinase [Agaribacter flavus]|uniref:Sensor histidine kinase n=1 Tax=Agaribacter flavus TaxID=1902781 RepID=A0ABV7FQP4_9ALTE